MTFTMPPSVNQAINVPLPPYLCDVPQAGQCLALDKPAFALDSQVLLHVGREELENLYRSTYHRPTNTNMDVGRGCRGKLGEHESTTRLKTEVECLQP